MTLSMKGVNMSQLSLFDAIQAREEAIEQVERNAEPEWKQACRDAIRELAIAKAEFTTDEVWEYLEAEQVELPHEVRAMGALMLNAARQGLIVASDRYRNSARVACHARPVRVWVSLCFQ